MRAVSIAALAAGLVTTRQLEAQTTGHSPTTNRNQNPTPSVVIQSPAADSSAIYDSQALRFEASWGSADVIRGAKGEVIGTVGWFRGYDVEKLVQRSSQATAAAHDFRVNNFRGSLVTTVGASLVAIGIVVAGNNSNNASTPVLIIAGAGGIGWGLHHINVGYAALSRALWWYNRDLARH
jgi:hypothetical protein